MSYWVDNRTGQVVGEFGYVDAPRFNTGDLVIEVICNELFQVVDRYPTWDSGTHTWIYVCRVMEIKEEEGRIIEATCKAELEEIPDAELQPLLPPRLPEEPKSLPPSPPRTAVPQTLVLRSFLPPQETPALTGPQEALQPPRRVLPQGLLLSQKGGGS